MKTLLALLAAVLVTAIFFGPGRSLADHDGQVEFTVRCEGGVCQIREADLVRIQQIVNALVQRVEELQAKSGCI